jgi:putative N6-adenine-specific DNA methylase
LSIIRYFATCARGLEPILAEELHDLKARDVKIGRGGVAFAGDKALLYKSNLWLRTAVRVLRPILEAGVTSPEELYAAVQTIDWEEFLTPEHTLAVDCNVRDSRITHSQYAARVVKDGICDQFVQRRGRRPSVDTERPTVGFNLHIYRDTAVLSLDSSWDSLHKRGYRPLLTRAPLNEALAAALVLRTGWRGDAPFVDPLCGSGTLPIEAAWIATNRPPGLTRKHFGFMGWMDYDVRLWTQLRDEARDGIGKRLAHPIVGTDERRDALEHSRTNARAAGVGHLVQFNMQDMRAFAPPPGPPGVLVCNPPYGERLGEEKDLRSLYRALGELFRRLPGWGAWLFTGNPRLAAAVDLPRAEEVPFYNGKIPCRFMRFTTG